MTKPYTWGGSIWKFEKSDVLVETSIVEIAGEDCEVTGIYDLSGRAVTTPATGIYIINGKKVLVK